MKITINVTEIEIAACQRIVRTRVITSVFFVTSADRDPLTSLCSRILCRCPKPGRKPTRKPQLKSVLSVLSVHPPIIPQS